jgi:uncharacterized cofD-like protein
MRIYRQAMKQLFESRLARFMLPGLKRWILTILIGISGIVFGMFLLLGYHPITLTGAFVRDLLEHAADVLPHRISGLLVIILGGALTAYAVAKAILSVLGAYLPSDRESIPEVLYRRRRLDRGPHVVVIGGGTGLANLLRGLKSFTNNITAVVTVGDDGGSSGRLREELGVLPPGDIRNCIAALADEEQLVTSLFNYRFSKGKGLEGHSFGNLFLSALCALTNDDMLEAVKVASRVLNSCGQVLPSTLSNLALVAELEDGSIVRGESHITAAGGSIKTMSTEPEHLPATPEVLEAIAGAEILILGPGSLYTSVIPNLLVAGIPEAIAQSSAFKMYICNVMTQPGETSGYSVGDHIEALIKHAHVDTKHTSRFMQAVMVNDEPPPITATAPSGCMPVRLDFERVRSMGVRVVHRPLVSLEHPLQHDPEKLAQFIQLWYERRRHRKPINRPRQPRTAATL